MLVAESIDATSILASSQRPDVDLMPDADPAGNKEQDFEQCHMSLGRTRANQHIYLCQSKLTWLKVGVTSTFAII